MKKWHMEGIVRRAYVSRRKLHVPSSNQLYLWSTAFAGESRKEFFLVLFLRNLVAFFLRGI